MSGILKPSVTGLGPEIIPTIIGSTAGWGGANALFDGLSVDGNTSTACFWGSSGSIELLISSKCNIWRMGPDYGYYSHFSILKYNGSTYDDVTFLYPQTVTNITNVRWEKTISNLPSGQYKFVGPGSRVDSEWYIENLQAFKCLIKDGNNIESTDGSTINYLDSIPFTIDKFDSYGFNDLSLLNLTILSNIVNDKYNIALLI